MIMDPRSMEVEKEHDRLFYELAYHVMYKENYVHRVKNKHNYAGEGNENKGLLSLLIADGKNFAEYLFEEEKYLGTKSIEEVLAEVANGEEEDGAYVLDGMNVSNKVIFDSLGDLRQKFAPKDEHDTYCIRNRKQTKKFLERHFPNDFRYLDGRKIDFGTKTSEAGSLGLIGEGNKVYMVKQTAYDHTSTGKTFRCGEYGMEQEFFLLKTDEKFKSNFYFDDGIVGVVRTYRPSNGYKKVELVSERYIKPEELKQYIEGKGELNLYTKAAATRKHYRRGLNRIIAKAS